MRDSEEREFPSYRIAAKNRRTLAINSHLENGALILGQDLKFGIQVKLSNVGV